MRWEKQGRVFVPAGDVEWAKAYAFPPTPLRLSDDVLRLYVGMCDENTVGRVGWVDVRAENPSEIVGVSEAPVLDIGEPGMFDDNGVVPTCVVDGGDGRLFMYYVGFQLGTHVPYFQFLGLAISDDGGVTFTRARRTPILERSDREPSHRTSAFVRPEGDGFRMWYVAGDHWTAVNGKPLPVYNLHTITSPDGIEWGPRGEVCLDFADEDEHAFGRPWLFEHDGRTAMLFSVRRRSNDYRLGLAISDDGVRWERAPDAEVGIDVSPDGWDSEMVGYSSIATHGDTTYLFYNGNGRGKTGFGYAVLAER